MSLNHQIGPWPRIYEARATLCSGAPAPKPAIVKAAVCETCDDTEALIANARVHTDDSHFVKIDHGLSAEDAPIVSSVAIVSERLKYIKSVAVRSKYGTTFHSGEYMRVAALLDGDSPNCIRPVGTTPAIAGSEPVRIFVALKDSDIAPDDVDKVLRTYLNQDVASVVLAYATLAVDIDLAMFVQAKQIKEEFSAFQSYTPQVSGPRVVEAVCPITKKNHIVQIPQATGVCKLVFWYSTPQTPYLDLLISGKVRYGKYDYPFSRELVLNMDKLMAGAPVPMIDGALAPIYTLTSTWPDLYDPLELHLISRDLPANTSLNVVQLCQERIQTAEDALGEWHAYGSSWDTRADDNDTEDSKSEAEPFDFSSGAVVSDEGDEDSVTVPQTVQALDRYGTPLRLFRATGS